ncbi:MAG: hypothetical protein JWN78_84 [Bacteroidota bacterium]|nr:hypothetical protein [Bacteroidota bacterium]
MKKILLIAGFFLTVLYSNATDWFPVGAQWYYGIVECCGPPSQGYSYHEVIKDTVIDIKNCKVISFTEHYSSDYISYGRYIMYQAGDKIYRYSDGNFLPLYDFSKNAGDSVLFITDTITGRCDSFLFKIDSVNIYQGVRVQFGKVFAVCEQKQLLVNSNPYMTVYEKIGHPGFFNDCYFLCTDVNSYYLRCYEDSSININNGNCDFITNTKQKEIKNAQVKIYPNPANEKLGLEFSKLLNAEAQVIIINDLGELVYSEKIYGISSYTSIGVGNLTSGLYLFKLITGEEIISKSFIVQH